MEFITALFFIEPIFFIEPMFFIGAFLLFEFGEIFDAVWMENPSGVRVLCLVTSL